MSGASKPLSPYIHFTANQPPILRHCTPDRLKNTRPTKLHRHSMPHTFRPCPGLAGPHRQTIWPSMFRKQSPLARTRERLTTYDNDFIDLDWCGDASSRLLVVLLHGLTGSSDSQYIMGLQAALAKEGVQSVCMNFRGCSGEPNLLPRSYHSGDSAELDFVLKTLHERYPERQLAAVGYSLGGNVLLKYQGETGKNSLLTKAAAVSVPFRLDYCARQMDKGLSKIYRNRLIAQMHQQLYQKIRYFEQQGWSEKVRELNLLTRHGYLNSFEAFDHHITAQLNGFSSGQDYYQQCSSRYFLTDIHKPTLIIHSKDDPFMTPDTVPFPSELSSSIELALTEKGGHVGFVGGHPNRVQYWLEERIPLFLLDH